MVASLVLSPDTDSLPIASSDDDSDEEGLDIESSETQETAAATKQQGTPLEAQLKALQKELADAKQWEARFKGTQPVIQRTSEEAKRLKGEKEVLEARLAQLQISLLPEDQQQQALTNYQTQYQLRLSEEQRQQVEEQRQQEAAVMDGVFREIVLNSISSKYGVPRDDLEDFTDPLSMEKYANKVKELRDKSSASAKKQVRKDSQADDFEGSTSVPIPTKEPETMDEANQLFAATIRKMMKNRR